MGYVFDGAEDPGRWKEACWPLLGFYKDVDQTGPFSHVPEAIAFADNPTYGASIKNTLVSWWDFSDATDAHGSNDFTEVSTPTYETGKVGNAVQTVEGNGNYLVINPCPANLKLDGDQAFTIATWVQLNNENLDYMGIIGAWTPAGSQRGYLVRIDNALNLDFFVSSDGIGNTKATWGSPLTNGVWYFIVAIHDPANDIISINVNQGTPVTAAHSTGIHATTGNFIANSQSNDPTNSELDGLQDSLGIFSSVLTAQNLTDLYNGGSGVAYSDL